jgi:antitoxin (DNA-binding transcriptional repressor) of toxin-antitoxin stability system
VKTISAEQAAREFEEYSKLAHEGERILVTLHGKPWILLSPATIEIKSEQRAISSGWPDFAARLAGTYPGPASGPTAAEILAEDRNDRF